MARPMDVVRRTGANLARAARRLAARGVLPRDAGVWVVVHIGPLIDELAPAQLPWAHDEPQSLLDVLSTLLDAAPRCSSLLGAARRCSSLLVAARRCATLKTAPAPLIVFCSWLDAARRYEAGAQDGRSRIMCARAATHVSLRGSYSHCVSASFGPEDPRVMRPVPSVSLIFTRDSGVSMMPPPRRR